MTGIGNGRMAEAGSLIRTHLRAGGGIVAEFLALLAVHSGKQQVESEQENGSILGARESLLLSLFIYLDDQLSLWPNFCGTASQVW